MATQMSNQTGPSSATSWAAFWWTIIALIVIGGLGYTAYQYRDRFPSTATSVGTSATDETTQSTTNLNASSSDATVVTPSSNSMSGNNPADNTISSIPNTAPTDPNGNPNAPNANGVMAPGSMGTPAAGSSQ